MKTTMNLRFEDHVTIREGERFFYNEAQWNAILVIVDSRITRAGYVHTVAPLGCVDGECRPIMREQFEAPASDLVRT